ncbi:hypothetical protein HFD88_008533 [Aspergillus terreus]|nr:hypothetical protein HFD88_008533 [Aspergillus terreus]
MNADQLLYQMDHSSTQNEWYDFENFFDFPSGCLDSNSTSVDSISPKDYDLSYNDIDGLEWESAQLPVPDMVNYETPFGECVDQALGMSDLNADPNDFLQFPPQSPKEDVAAPHFSNPLSLDVPSNADSFYSTLRHLVESQAAAEPHGPSQKEKRRDAAIAIHLQRLQGTSIPDLELFPEAPGFPSPPEFSSTRCGPSESPASVSLSESTSKSSTPPSGPDSTAGGMELVLDLNMNTPANLPRKQKPRSRAQKENYIKVRKHGACEKHRKQHKRCNCLDVNASRLNANPTTLLASNRTIHMADNSKANQCRAQSTTNKRLGSKSLAPGGPSGFTPCASWNPQLPYAHYEYTNPKNGGPAVGYNATFNPSQIEPPGYNSNPIRLDSHDKYPAYYAYRSNETQPTKLGEDAVHLQSVPGRSVVPTKGQLVKGLSLVNTLGSVMQKTVGALSSFVQASTSASSWASTLFGRFVIFSSRQYFVARKGMGLF